ncbi:MAG TPA: hypothetical protein IAC19_03970 [Candidatus Ventricola gallistercoris]|nr:hypothetical protein [Candidatus Ventricola gallistercoris]
MYRRIVALLLCVCALLPACALAAEGDPLLSVDDLLSLEESYEAFLNDLEELIVSRGLLQESERQAWHDAQMGDFFQNGGYGSILFNYTPGVLSYTRGEETLCTLRSALEGCTLEVLTMRRYTPQDSSLPGLMLTLSAFDDAESPLLARYTLSATSGIFLKWDALQGRYVSVGASATSDGETIVFSDQTPAVNARGPVITISVQDAATQTPLGEAALTLTVDGEGFALTDNALTGISRLDDAQTPAP